MSLVQSIIIFNGGSAGDFLRIASLEQLTGFNRFRIDDNGTARSLLQDNYFKEFCKAEQRTQQRQVLDPDRCFEIENAHSYHPWFQELTTNLFYIKYNEEDALPVINAFICKRLEADFNLWVKLTMPPQTPSVLLDKITLDNFSNVLSIFWKKNMSEWDLNSSLTPIPFRDLFDLPKLSKWVERLCGQPLRDPAQLAKTHQAWLNKNSILSKILT